MSLIAERPITPEEAFSQKQMLELALSALTEREKLVLKSIFVEGQSAKDCGKELHRPISQARAWQIKEKALRKARGALFRAKLRPNTWCESNLHQVARPFGAFDYSEKVLAWEAEKKAAEAREKEARDQRFEASYEDSRSGHPLRLHVSQREGPQSVSGVAQESAEARTVRHNAAEKRLHEWADQGLAAFACVLRRRLIQEPLRREAILDRFLRLSSSKP